MWVALGDAGVTEPSEADADDDDGRARRGLAAAWLPPAVSEVEGQRIALQEIAAAHGLEAIWCVKVETGIDGIAWLELTTPEAAEEEDDDDPAAPGGEVVDAIFEHEAEVLYSAPDAPPVEALATAEVEEPDDPEDDSPEDVELAADVELESHWRNGVPPCEHSVAFPIERYPDVIDDYDWESFGIAIKLAGAPLPGEESVINAFFALW